VPGTTWEEIISLASLCHNGDKLVASHVRMDVDGVFDAAAELARIGKEACVKVQFSHVGSMGGYGQMSELLEQLDGYRKEGIDIMCDCYPYNAFSTGIGETTYDEGFLERYKSDYDGILILDGKYAGQRCTKEIFDEVRRDAPNTGTVGYFMKAEDVELALECDFVMLGSDGVRHGTNGHPRASGSFPKFISDYIGTNRISLIDGVAKMTTMAADRLNLPQKGNFLPGSDADITIFDLEKVEDCATYENGLIAPKGIDYVLINGEIALKDGEVINDRLGRAVRR
jgi:N-acyl-D-amino-acid deacylase